MDNFFGHSDLSQAPLLDVRSPGEFHQGHIPGAISFPLFSDEERAAVGTLYKQTGKEAAMLLGLRYVGPKLEHFVRQALEIAPHRRVRVHCWRGGQRSGSMAWLLRQSGFEVETLRGGYKAYRQWLLQSLENTSWKLVILGGRTGSGKTKILQELQALGEQVVDLEAIAHHKGSAFGFIGEAPQPTVEQFENNMFEALQQLDVNRRIWVENESHSIGRVFIPRGFWEKMKSAPLLNISIPDADRIQNLLDDYVLTNRDDLKQAFNKIAKKLGGLQLKTATEALDAGDHATAAKIALQYYDKTYQHCLDMSVSLDIRHVSFDHGVPKAIAETICHFPIP